MKDLIIGFNGKIRNMKHVEADTITVLPSHCKTTLRGGFSERASLYPQMSTVMIDGGNSYNWLF